MLLVKAVCVIALAVNLFLGCCCGRNCFVFEDNANVDVLVASRGSYVKLTFTVPSECYPGATKIDSITVSNVTSGADVLYCQLLGSDYLKCDSQRPQNCGCSKFKEYRVNFQTSNSARCEIWRLKVGFDNGKSLMKRLKFFIADPSRPARPPTIKQLAITIPGVSVNSSTPATVVEINSSVNVLCLWEGSPPYTAKLFRHTADSSLAGGSNGLEQLKTTEKVSWQDGCSRHTYYVIEKVQCDDMGKLTCQVNGTSASLSQTLLVKCPPMFAEGKHQVQTIPKKSRVQLYFPVRVHEIKITDCYLIATGAAVNTSSTAAHNPPSRPAAAHTRLPCHKPEVVGELPDVVLTILMINVTSASAGSWRLEMTNGGGKSSLDFIVKVNSESTNVLILAAAAIGCVGFSVVIAFVICAVHCWRKGSRDRAAYRDASGVARFPSSRPPAPCPRGTRQDAVECADYSAPNHYVASSGTDLESCDSWLIDRIYSEIKDHALRHDNP